MYQKVLDDLYFLCNGDLAEMDIIANAIHNFVVLQKADAGEDQLMIHGFCE